MGYRHTRLLPWLMAVFPLIASRPCEDVQVQVLFDISMENDASFKEKQERTFDVLRHLDVVGKGRNMSFGFVAFHANSVVLTSLKSGQSRNVKNVMDHVDNVRPRPGLRSSTKNSLNAAYDQFVKYSAESAKKIVIMVSTLKNVEDTDVQTDVLGKLSAIGVKIYVITDSVGVSTGLKIASTKEDVYDQAEDLEKIFHALDSFISCQDPKPRVNTENVTRSSIQLKEQQPTPSTLYSISLNAPDFHCTNDTVIYIIVDSASTQNVKQRTVVKDIVLNLPVNQSAVVVSNGPNQMPTSNKEVLLQQLSHVNPNTLQNLSGLIQPNESAVVILIYSESSRVMEAKVEWNAWSGLTYFVSDLQKEHVTLSRFLGKKAVVRKPTKPSSLAGVCSVVHRKPSRKRIAQAAPTFNKNNNCTADILFLVDTSQSVESVFQNQLQFLYQFVSVVDVAISPDIRIGIVTFNNESRVLTPFRPIDSSPDLGHMVTSISHTGGPTSIVSAAMNAATQIKQNKRDAVAVVTVILSDGQSQDLWEDVIKAADKLRESSDVVLAVTVSDDYYLKELELYAGDSKRVYLQPQVDSFIKGLGENIPNCATRNSRISSTSVLEARDVAPLSHVKPNSEQTTYEIATPKTWFRNCSINKLDMIIILDASTSREHVFEHQRELALSLIERLPISDDDTRVATGINTFNDKPTLRQTLMAGKNRQTIRKSIEDIAYTGGSTHTAKALQLAQADLETNNRAGALKLIVLITDGMSQDPWTEVLQTSELLKQKQITVYGVALGSDVDLRELVVYTGNESHIFQDGSTEKFLNEVTRLIYNSDSCLSGKGFTEGLNFPKATALPKTNDSQSEPTTPSSESVKTDQVHVNPDLRLRDPLSSSCGRAVDVLAVMDASNSSNNPEFTNNRYLLLDILGSLPMNSLIKVSVHAFSRKSRLIHGFSDVQRRSSLSKKIDAMVPQGMSASYVNGVNAALNYFKKNKRPDSKGIMIIVGGAHSTVDSEDSEVGFSKYLANTRDLTITAVTNENTANARTLARLTGDENRIYTFHRNSDFAEALKNELGPDCDEGLWEGSGQDEERQRDDRRSTHDDISPADRPKLIRKIKSDKTRTLSSTAALSEIGEEHPRFPNEIATNCAYDVLFLMDSSGSVSETLAVQKQIAEQVLDKLNVSAEAVNVAIVKFSSTFGTRTLHAFHDPQERKTLASTLGSIRTSHGVTAIHRALRQAAAVYKRSTRKAPRMALIFTDGFGNKDFVEEASSLRAQVPDLFAVAINHEHPINRRGLRDLVGSSDRVYTQFDLAKLYSDLRSRLGSCWQ